MKHKKTRDRLSDEELQKIERWQRRMIIYFVVFLVSLGVLLIIDLTFGIPQFLETVLIFGWILFLILGIYIQFSLKCPACGFRIGIQSRLIAPPSCPRCDISFRRPERELE